MTFEHYWLKLLQKNPISDTQRVSMSKQEFRKILEQSFNIGFNEAKNSLSLFETIFGKGK